MDKEAAPVCAGYDVMESKDVSGSTKADSVPCERGESQKQAEINKMNQGRKKYKPNLHWGRKTRAHQRHREHRQPQKQ